MIKIKFTIPGNQEDYEGNPTPFTRAIKGHWNAAATRYMDWQAYVRIQFIRAQGEQNLPDLRFPTKSKGRPTNKPIRLGEKKAFVQTVVSWADDQHGDGDNVHKGILDALFEDDKNVEVGFYTSKVSKDGKGKVEVTVLIMDEDEEAVFELIGRSIK
jgi:hypothetical protein